MSKNIEILGNPQNQKLIRYIETCLRLYVNYGIINKIKPERRF